MNAIEICGLAKAFRERTAVHPLELCIPEGEMFSLLGVNGAGKTTLIRMLCGLLPPTAGDARLNGYSIRTARGEARRTLSASLQETAIAPKLTVEENLTLMAGMHKSNQREIRDAAERMLTDMHLTEIRRQRAGTLSGGWQRRLSLAMALVSSPSILFLDEPTLGLDVLARRELWRYIEALKGRCTVILTTHYLEEAENLCDRIAIMAEGRLCAAGSVEELKNQSGCESFEDAFIHFVGGRDTDARTALS